MKTSPEDLLDSPKAIIDFTASWCGPCKRIAPHFKKFESDYPNITFFKIDVDEYRELAEQFKISAMPTFVILQRTQDHEMEEIGRMSGCDEYKLKQLLEQLEMAN